MSVPYSVRVCFPFNVPYRFLPRAFLRLRTEPLILTFRFIVFDREPYRTKMGAVTCLSMGNGPHFGAVRLAVLNIQRIMVPHFSAIRFALINLKAKRQNEWFGTLHAS